MGIDEKGWVGSDIPEENQVVMVTPHHKEVLTGEALEAAKELFRYTKPAEFPIQGDVCTSCGSEDSALVLNLAGWQCIDVAACCARMLKEEPKDDPSCKRCGGHQNVYLLQHGYICDYCLSGDTMPDYEALGYPETEASERNDIEHAAFLVGFVSRGIWHSSRSLAVNQKDIRSDTESVDEGDPDSYNKIIETAPNETGCRKP